MRIHSKESLASEICQMRPTGWVLQMQSETAIPWKLTVSWRGGRDGPGPGKVRRSRGVGVEKDVGDVNGWLINSLLFENQGWNS